jgi:hypothetical protein
MKKLFVLIGLAAAGCTGGARDSMTLSARLGASGGQPLPATGSGVQAASGIELSRVRIAVRRLRLERNDDATEVKITEGPLLLDVNGSALGGALIVLVTANVRPGIYDKLKLDIHPVVTSPSAAFDDLVRRGTSVLVEGTVDGQPFTFAAGLEAELEHEGRFQLGGAATNITLDIDASKWFQAADGSRLSPLDPAARDAILANIRASVTAFDHDDEDGIEDEREDDGGDDRGEHDGGDDRGAHDGGDHGGGDGGSGRD